MVSTLHRSIVVRDKLSTAFDIVLLGTPLLIGTAFVVPFVAADLVRGLIRDRRIDRENQQK